MIRRFGLLLALASIIGWAACGGGGGEILDGHISDGELFAQHGYHRAGPVNVPRP